MDQFGICHSFFCGILSPTDGDRRTERSNEMTLILEMPRELENELLAQWQEVGLISDARYDLTGERLRLPHGLQSRLHDLLDRQDGGVDLTADERLEAENLVELSEFLSLLQLRTLATPHPN